MKTKTLFFLSFALFILAGCKKNPSASDDIYIADGCYALSTIHISSNSPVQIGDKMKFSVPEIGGRRIYSWIGPNNYRSQYTSDSILKAELKYEGWYYLDVSRDDCLTVKTDSFYFDVKLKQGTPACNTTANICEYSNLFDDSYTIIKKSINPVYNVLTLSANGNGNMNILFHPAWKNKEPEDGIYTTTSAEFFDQTDYNYNKVYVTTTKQSINWGSHPDQQVFVSHVNGKLQVRFCDLVLAGSNGTSYTTSATGNLIEQ